MSMSNLFHSVNKQFIIGLVKFTNLNNLFLTVKLTASSLFGMIFSL